MHQMWLALLLTQDIIEGREVEEKHRLASGLACHFGNHLAGKVQKEKMCAGGVQFIECGQ